MVAVALLRNFPDRRQCCCVGSVVAVALLCYILAHGSCTTPNSRLVSKDHGAQAALGAWEILQKRGGLSTSTFLKDLPGSRGLPTIPREQVSV